MFYTYIKEAGFIWMMPIVFLSFCALAFCLERSWYWLQLLRKTRQRYTKLRQFFSLPFTKQTALQICTQSQDVIFITLGKFLQYYDDLTLTIAERKTRMFAEKKVDETRQFLDLLSLIANISGTLGLMGTVVGISLSFKTMASQDSKAMATSLSTALYTTIGGIILFLLAYLFLFFLQKLTDHLENELETNIQRLKDILETEEKSRLIFEKNAKQAAPQKITKKKSKTAQDKKDNDNAKPLKIVALEDEKK